jgi:GTP-binding protein EngB required for normal cell division
MTETKVLIKFQIDDNKPKAKKLDLDTLLIDIRSQLGLPDSQVFLVDDCEVDIDDEATMQLKEICNEGKMFKICTIQTVAEAALPQQVVPVIEKYPVLPHVKFLEVRNNLKIYEYPRVLLQPDKRYPNARIIDEKDLHSAKYVILLGQTGSGKTTTINSLVNYLLGVRIEDDFRYELITDQNRENQTKSQTSEPNIYCVHSQIGYPWTIIIDTPGFGDTGGIEQDKEIDKMLNELFKIKVSMIHLVCFVIKGSQNRIGPMENYVFGQVLKLFGKDIADNFLFLITFADGGKAEAEKSLVAKESAVADIISNLAVQDIIWKCKFNNSAVNKKYEPNDHFTIRFWDMYQSNMKDFMHKLIGIQERSLVMTNDVIHQRAQLDMLLADFHNSFAKALADSKNLSTILDQLESSYAKLEANKDYEITTQDVLNQKIPIRNGTFTTYCNLCIRTCHEHCGFGPGKSKRGCAAMSGDNCKICPGKCHHTNHVHVDFIIKPGSQPVKRTLAQVKQLYDAADASLNEKENLVLGILRKQDDVYLETLKIKQGMKSCINILNEIALRPNCFNTTADYIRIVLTNEESSPTRDQAKVELLRKTLDVCMIADKMMKGDEQLASIPEEKALETLINKGVFRKSAADVKQFLQNRTKK